jgi:hypothetical protein
MGSLFEIIHFAHWGAKKVGVSKTRCGIIFAYSKNGKTLSPKYSSAWRDVTCKECLKRK